MMEDKQGGKPSELLDIFDSAMNRIGTAARREAHERGLWHQTFHCWIVTRANGGPELLFQLRHQDKDTFPGLLDISSAGHLLAGESPESGVRELEEELGLRVRFEDLIPCGVFPEEDFIAEGCIDREFCHIFVHLCDQPLHEYCLQPDEVTGLFRAALADVKALVSGSLCRIEVTGFELDESGERISTERSVGLEHLTPHPQAYYAVLFGTLDKLLSEA